MHESSSPVIVIITVGVAIAISVLVRQGRRQSRSTDVAPRERIRPLAITFLDPIVSVIIIGPFVGSFVAHSITHVLAASLGAVGGIVIGYARARTMFVRAIKETKSVVLRRSSLEYALVVVLVALRPTQGYIGHWSSSLAQYLVTALASLALVEALARSGFIVQMYRHSLATNSSLTLENETPQS